MILFHETLYQKTDDGTPFIKLIKDLGIIGGIKVRFGYIFISLFDAALSRPKISTLREIVFKLIISG